jgi:NAD(P)-dependent dehydrogenase (short-subunit alcohol dehydrogenase family)
MNLIAEDKQWIQNVWRDAKRWRKIPLGPIQLTLKLSKRDAAQKRGSLGLTPRPEKIRGIPDTGLVNRGPAVVVGVGPGLGEHAARLFALKGLPVVLVSRSADALQTYADSLSSIGRKVRAIPCDVTDERAVMKLMQTVESEFGAPEVIVYAVQTSNPGSLVSTEAAAFEECWRRNCLGAFIVAREAAKRMITARRGTILFAGATSGTVGRKGYVNLAIGKFGLRALAQVMARELGPDGVHVTHIVIDGNIAGSGHDDNGPQINPEELAELLWSVHQQPRSCWTSELDVRPAEEEFWEHC